MLTHWPSCCWWAPCPSLTFIPSRLGRCATCSRRMYLVQVRAGEYGSLRRLLLRQGILSSKQQEIKTATEAELEQWFEHPLVRLHASQELRRIELYSEQIRSEERRVGKE